MVMTNVYSLYIISSHILSLKLLNSGPVQACHVEMLTELLQYHLRDIAESVRSLKEMVI